VLREARQQVPSELLAFGTTVKKKESKVRVQRARTHAEHVTPFAFRAYAVCLASVMESCHGQTTAF